MTEIYLSIITGLSIGFLGSFHCIGMCGPIALALPVQSLSGWQKYLSVFHYNLGRAVTYGLLGLLFGFLGQQFRLWGLQQWVSISAGVLILVFILSRYSFTSRIKWLGKFNNRVQYSLGKLLSSPKTPVSFLSIGILNGLLPCGLVYVAIPAAIATGDALHGALLMFAFGLGTVPVMAGLTSFGHLISYPIRQRLNRAVPLFIGMMAVILILRGLNLGIPFLSPKLMKDSTSVECCHRPA